MTYPIGDSLSHDEYKNLMHSIFRFSANYVTDNINETMRERSKIFSSCTEFLRRTFHSLDKRFENELKRSAHSYISNLILYGVNPQYAGFLRKLSVTTLDEFFTLLIQFWHCFNFGKNIPDFGWIYFACKIRTENSTDKSINEKFDQLFSEIIPLEKIIQKISNRRAINILILENILLGSIEDTIILYLILKQNKNIDPDQQILDSEKMLRQNHLFKISGCSLDMEKISPRILIKKQ